jgi:hypothetical protein
MNIAFLTESNFVGKIDPSHSNLRTELAWQLALESTHYNINDYIEVKNFDCVFVIIPKGRFFLSADGVKLINGNNWISPLLKSDFTSILKNNNKKIFFIQEGSVDMYTDMSVEDQFYYYNHLQNFDIIFAHNDLDRQYYKGMFPNKTVYTIPTLMYSHLIENIEWKPENKVIIGGNFSRFYGGFQSYMVSEEFKNCSKWTIESHAKREDESLVPDLNHLPRLLWVDWMKNLSTFKFAIHMMPIYAAGTFMLNCAYYGIPCIAPNYTNTQNLCYPECSVSCVNDVESARFMAEKLSNDSVFYKKISDTSKQLSRDSLHINVDKWKAYMYDIIL